MTLEIDTKIKPGTFRWDGVTTLPKSVTAHQTFTVVKEYKDGSMVLAPTYETFYHAQTG